MFLLSAPSLAIQNPDGQEHKQRLYACLLYTSGFVGPNGKPIPLTEEEVAALGVEKREIEVNYEAGDTVRIIDGPLENFTGIVDEVDLEKNKVRVTISMFGRETPVELELDQAELME